MFRCLILIAALGFAGCPEEPPSPTQGTSAEAEVYICPMRCSLEGQKEPYTQPTPGSCPVCKMDLEAQPSK